METVLPKITELALEYGPKVLLALIVLIVGLALINNLIRILGKMMKKRGVDDSLQSFLRSLLSILLKVMLGLSVLGMVGIEVTSFIALLGAAGLAVGMALSGTLQNFAGGVMILLFKPFKVGDYIKAQGFAGTVREIQVFNTILNTPDNITIIIPNGGLANGAMTNYSTEATRRVDWEFGIGYGDDTGEARNVLRQLMDADPRILKDPEPFIATAGLGDSSVNMVVRAWVNSSDYWAVHFDMNDKVYKEFSQRGLNIPFPQMDVHLHQN